jgi:ABC-2 type transport system permease protein
MTDQFDTHPLKKSFLTEVRILFAFAKKEWLSFVHYPTWIAGLIISPFLFVLPYILGARALAGPNSSGLGAFSQITGTDNYIVYIIIGSALWLWLNGMLWDIGHIVRTEQWQGTLEQLWVCPIPKTYLLIGGGLMHTAINFFYSLIIAFEVWIIWRPTVVIHFGLLFLITLLCWFSLYGVSLIYAGAVLRFQEATALYNILNAIFFALCGVTFPIELLPGWLQAVAKLIPLTWAIRDMRLVLLGGTFANINIQRDILLLAIFALFLPLAGYLIFMRIERSTKKNGSLSNY